MFDTTPEPYASFYALQPITFDTLIKWGRGEQVHVGDFLVAVLCNNFKEAVFRADELNGIHLRAIAIFIYNELPPQSQGSPEKVRAWLETHPLCSCDPIPR